MSQVIKVADWTDDPVVSAVFVHGLGGQAYETWQRKGVDQSFWPMWLAEDVGSLAVYTVSYEAPTSNWIGTAMPLQDRAVNILESLLSDRKLCESPIIFICHSLGGLIVKQLVLDLHQQKGRRAAAARLLEQIKGVIFIATPHTGSRSASLLDRLSFLAWPSMVARSLVANDPNLRSINVAYRGLAEELRGQLRHRIFYETRGTAFGVIVDEASSDPGLPGDPPIPIDADHITIAKPLNREALLYSRTLDFFLEQSSITTHSGTLVRYALPNIRNEQPWNIFPKLLRIALIVLICGLGFKGLQALLSPALIPAAKIEKLTQAQTQLVEQNKDIIALIKSEKGVPREALVGQLIRLGANNNIKSEDIPQFLEKFATEFLETRKRLDDLSKTSPDIGPILNDANRLLNANDLDGAKAQLAQAREQIKAQRVSRSLEEARLLAEEARIDRLQLYYRAAAQKFGEAATLVAFDGQASFQYLFEQGNALSSLGAEFGDNSALNEAIAVWKRATELRPRTVSLADFVAAMNGLGNALFVLGQNEKGSLKLVEAEDIYSEVLKYYPRTASPQGWAEAEARLASVFFALGQRDPSSTYTAKAVSAYRDALKEFPRESDPLWWAHMQDGLGDALFWQASAQNSSSEFDEAIAAYREALKEYTREKVPLEWARVQNGIANALSGASGHEAGIEKLEGAVAAYRASLEIATQQRAPRYRAVTQTNLGYALYLLGTRRDGENDLKEAMEAYRQALTVLTPELAPLERASTIGADGLAMMLLAKRRGDASMAATALDQIETAIKVLKDGGDPSFYEGQLPAAQATLEQLKNR